MTSRRVVLLVCLFATLIAWLSIPSPHRAAAAVQRFDLSSVDWNVCYGPDTVVPGTLGCTDPGTWGTTSHPLPADSPVATYDVLKVAEGSRWTMPTIYSVGVVPAPQNVTLRLDMFCDGVTDVIADGPPTGASGLEDANQPWPNASVWSPYPLSHLTTPPTGDDAYIPTIKQTPSSFTNASYYRANLNLVWLGGATPLLMTAMQSGAPMKLSSVVETSPYQTNLSVQQFMLGGDLSPPSNGFLCLDTPEQMVWQSTFTTPATPGLYPRWATMTSAPDPIDGSVTRILQVRCLAVVVTSGSCDLGDTTDHDGVPNAVEAVLGTDPTSTDTDADGATDFEEIFQFTDPGCAGGTPHTCASPAGRPPDTRDTDGDGSWDEQDDLAGLNCANTTTLTCTTVNNGDLPATGAGSDDNCPAVANPTQLNTDSLFDLTNTPNVPAGTFGRADATNPHQDHLGDACDPDIDNDGMDNVVEAGFNHTNVAPGCLGLNNPAGSGCTTAGPTAGTLWCLPQGATAPTGGMTTVATDPLNPDSDSDGGLDGRECEFGSDPTSAAALSCSVYVPAQGIPPFPPNPPACNGLNRFPAASTGTDPDGDLLYPNAAEVFYRTQSINQPPPSLGQLLDLEQVTDGKVGPNDNDSDGDKLNDGWEAKWYGTSPAAFDTDADGCADGTEAADVNGDHKVNATDQVSIGAHTTAGTLPPNPPYNTNGVRRNELATYDVNKDGSINSNDQLVDGSLFGNCTAGTGAQTAQPITSLCKPGDGVLPC